MSLKSLLYVSESLLRLPGDAGQLQDIVAVSQQKNASLDVTSVFVAARDHFAQVLEGPEASLLQLMDSITADPRHRRVTIVSNGQTAERQFGAWTMSLVYSGASYYIDRHIAPLLDLPEGASERLPLATQLYLLMRELSRVDMR